MVMEDLLCSFQSNNNETVNVYLVMENLLCSLPRIALGIAAFVAFAVVAGIGLSLFGGGEIARRVVFVHRFSGHAVVIAIPVAVFCAGFIGGTGVALKGVWRGDVGSVSDVGADIGRHGGVGACHRPCVLDGGAGGGALCGFVGRSLEIENHGACGHEEEEEHEGAFTVDALSFHRFRFRMFWTWAEEGLLAWRGFAGGVSFLLLFVGLPFCAPAERTKGGSALCGVSEGLLMCVCIFV